MHVSDYLQDCEVPFETVLHPPAFTAQKRARFLHVSGRQVVKCVVLSSRRGFHVAVLRSTDHIDLTALERRLGASIRLATPEEMAEQLTDCGRGAATPFGSLYGLRTLLEDRINPDDLIIFEAQQHHIAVRMLCRDFERLEKPMRCRFARNDTMAGRARETVAR